MRFRASGLELRAYSEIAASMQRQTRSLLVSSKSGMLLSRRMGI